MARISTLLLLLWSCCPALAAPNFYEKRAIDAATFANLELFEQYAAAAYCPSNNDDPNGGKKLTCPPGPRQTTSNCPLVEANNVTTILEFQNSLITDVTGYLSLDTTHSLIVLSFRGSQSIRNYIANLNFPTTPAPSICPDCSINKGFYQSWQEAKPGVLSALTQLKTSHSDAKVVVTGHSLGGAIATIAAAEIRNGGTKAELYTYGAPRIGMAKVSDYISAQGAQGKGGNFRVTHTDDPVPKLPPLTLGYRHVSPEYFIGSGNNVAVKPGDVSVYSGNVNFGGNTGRFGKNGDAHGWYFNRVGGCSNGDFEIKV